MTRTDELDEADIRCVLAAAATLGESPVWDEEGGVLWWIDIHAPAIHVFSPASGEARSWPYPESLGSIGLRDGTGLVVASRSGFSLFDPADGGIVELARPTDELPDVRFNDGRVDRAGRFWSGTVHERREVGGAALYRLDPDGRAERMHDGVTVSNGIAWSPDDRIMHFADSHTRTVYAFGFDRHTGTIANPRVFARLDEVDGLPDGATVDAEGGYWLACYGGARLMRFAPDGRLDRTVPMPVTNPTSAAFGGADLATLYVTSARQGLDEAALAREPQAGGLFALDVGVAGLPEPRFAG